MLRSLNELHNYHLISADGDVGKLDDLLFDDHEWTIRYLVANTGSWLSQRLVLLSPTVIRSTNWRAKQVTVGLSKEKIENSPTLEQDKPVSRQGELELIGYYGWPMYWRAPMKAAVPAAQARQESGAAAAVQDDVDPHLRSVQEIIGYHIQATDGDIGHVEDFIADDDDWTIRYMVVDTRNWLPGRKVLVTPSMIHSVDWASETVTVELTREQIKGSPEFDPDTPVNREYEYRFFDYYGRPVYWTA